MPAQEPFMGVRTAQEIGERPSERFTNAELGLLAHLYRGEIYRSKIWRQRLDTTTNWAVGTAGIGLAAAFGHHTSSPIILPLTAFLVFTFLIIEGRRFRYWEIWQRWVRILEKHLGTPSIGDETTLYHPGWRHHLAVEIQTPRFYLTLWEAIGNRLRRNYSFLFLILGTAWGAKLVLHPSVTFQRQEVVARAAAGPVSGPVVLGLVLSFYLLLFLLAFLTFLPEEPWHLPPEQEEESVSLPPEGLDLFR